MSESGKIAMNFPRKLKKTKHEKGASVRVGTLAITLSLQLLREHLIIISEYSKVENHGCQDLFKVNLMLTHNTHAHK